jgi:hypothetical protein
MTKTQSILLPIVSIVLLVLFVSSLATYVYMLDFSHDCASQGGTYSTEGWTGWCRY